MRTLLTIFLVLQSLGSLAVQSNERFDALVETKTPCGPYTSIPDLKFEQYLIDNNIDSEGGELDGRVLSADIINVKELNLSGCGEELVNLAPGIGMTDLTGIQCFKNLEVLRIEGNKIKNVDLSYNTELKELRGWDNEMETLNVQGLKKLKIVGLNRNNLTDLDFSSNTSLEILHVASNRLSRFILPENYGSNKNSLESLVFSDNPGIDFTTLLQSRSSLRGSVALSSDIESELENYRYKSLLISNQNYTDEEINPLKFPHNDADKLKSIISETYSFAKDDIVHIKDGTRNDIIHTLDSMASTITEKDIFLIFYAGHGVFDQNLNKGYWLPINAHEKLKGNWISNSEIKDYLIAFKSQHTLLISDACFSGSIFDFKKRDISKEPKQITAKLLQKKSRKAMTSGLYNPVPDESKFIKYLLQELQNNQKAYLTAGQLFAEIREAVLSNTDNIPQFEVIKNADHEGGEFIFFRPNQLSENN